MCFFFQAEDGIRDYKVTGVQTCALPIFIFPATGTGGWEAALVNTLSPGDRVLAPRYGQFSHLWIDLAQRHGLRVDRKSTRLNSSHLVISYAVFCLKKKTKVYQLP